LGTIPKRKYREELVVIKLTDSTAICKTNNSIWLNNLVSKITGNNYHVNKKPNEWRLPNAILIHLKNQRIKLTFKNLTSTEKKLLKETNTEILVAVNRFKKNPFSVLSTDINLLYPDFTIKSDSVSTLIVEIGPFADYIPNEPRWLKSTDKFLISADLLNPFLLKLREHKQSFAVESEASILLTNGKDIRGKCSEGISLSSDEISTALLNPSFIKKNILVENSVTDLIGITKNEWKILNVNPKIKIFQNKDKIVSVELNSIETFQTLINFHLYDKKYWLATEVIKDLSILINQHDCNNPLLLGTPKKSKINIVALVTNKNIPTVILYDRALAKTLFNTVKPESYRLFNLNMSSCRSGVLAFFSLEDIEVINNFLEKYNDYNYWIAEEFRQLSTISLTQANLRKECSYYHELTDINLEINNRFLFKKLFPHQRVAIDFLLKRKQALLGDDMGLGKTLTILATTEQLLFEKKIELLLVVAPNSLVLNWIQEASVWLPFKKFEAVPKNKVKRDKLLKSIKEGRYPSIFGLIVNYETARVPEVTEQLLEISQNYQTFLCLDESQRVKNPFSKSFIAINNIAENAIRTVLLSGTPTPKNISDIWAQMRILDGGARFGTDYYNWLETIAELGNNYSKVAIRSFKSKEVAKTISRVKELLLRRKKEDVISLPEKIFITRNVLLGNDQQKRYNEICSELLLRMTSISGKQFIREIQNVLEHYLRAVQVASNPRLIDENWQGEPAKFIELDVIIDEIVREGGKKIVVWTNYRRNIEELLKRYNDLPSAAYHGDISQVDRANIVKTFQQDNNDLQILYAIPAAGGVGITLTKAQTAVYLDKTWNAEHWLQSIDRIHRIGQRGTVTVISLQSGSIDTLIAKNLAKKWRNQEKLLSGNNSDIIENDLMPTKEELIEAVRVRK
jgi:SWI/SNF-related matrix-associated actin-dependent regulator of chromatin subfamily A-like protein 1